MERVRAGQPTAGVTQVQAAMKQPSAVLRALLTSLTQAKQGTTLVLDGRCLAQTGAAALLRIFSEQLRITSFTLNNVVLPAAVTDDTLAVSGESGGVTLALMFQDVLGELAIQALFQAPTLPALLKQFPSLTEQYF